MLETNDYFKSSLEDKAYFLTEVAEATKTGVYSANFKQNRFYIDDIGKQILNMPSGYTPSINEATYLFCSSKDARDLLSVCLKNIKFERDVCMSCYEGTEIWARFTGKAKFDDIGDLIGIRGVFTSIDTYVRRQQDLEKHSATITAQNDRLLHFTHIVSHNLRTHSSNLELTLELFKDVSEDERLKVFYSYLNEISGNLSATLEHLNQVLTINSHQHTVSSLDLEEITDNIIKKYQKDIDKIGIVIHTDFSKLKVMDYVPAFMENIIDTLLSNAIFYHDLNRPLTIQVRTKTIKGKNLFIVKDNGRGIDLANDESGLFKSGAPYLGVKDVKGMSLFLAKNQVESFGGDLVVKSVPGVGSSFTVKF